MDATVGRDTDTDHKFWLIFEQGAAGMALISPKGRYLRANPVLCRMLGYTEEQLTSLALTDITHPEDAAIATDLWNDLLSGEAGSEPAELRYLRSDGQVVWAILTLTLVQDESGLPVQAIAVIEDITRRKQAQAEFERAKKLYQAVWDNLDDFISINDHSGDFLFASGASAGLTGYTPAELVGTNLFRYVHPDDHDTVYRAYRAFGEGLNEQLHLRYRAFHKDGAYVWLETRATPFSGGGDFDCEIICVSRRGTDPSADESHMAERPDAEEQAPPPHGDASIDNLTGTRQRGYADDVLGAMVVSRRSAGFPFGVLLVDVDHFAALNDAYGPLVGGEILKRVARTLLDTCRLDDTVARAGGGAFLVVLPNTNAPGTIAVGERLVQDVGSIDWSDLPLESEVTISAGATCVTYGVDLTLPELMGILQDQVAQAQESGRNRLVMNTRQVWGPAVRG
jgi:diguanylate cyclase (GGDEF)-like protein/PAS domain S-box-containing protein